MRSDTTQTSRTISFVGLLQVVALFTFAASLLGVAGSSFWPVELFSHFKLAYILASTVCFIIFVLLRHNLSALIMFLIFMVNIVSISPVFFAAAEAKASSVEKVKIFLSNIYSQNSQYHLLLDRINREDPDIVVLQELTPEWLQQIKPLLDKYPYHELVPQAGHFGIALLSRIPVSQVQRFAPAITPAIHATFDISGRQFNLLAAHLMPPESFELKTIRDRQLDAIGDFVTHQQLPVLVVGDLNVTPWSADYQRLISATGLLNVRQGKGIWPTWPAKLSLVGLPLDHILYSSEWLVERVYTTEYIGSDHLPIVSELSF